MFPFEELAPNEELPFVTLFWVILALVLLSPIEEFPLVRLPWVWLLLEELVTID